jgi:hypothetical protein
MRTKFQEGCVEVLLPPWPRLNEEVIVCILVSIAGGLQARVNEDLGTALRSQIS